jgi:hypothetical protein
MGAMRWYPEESDPVVCCFQKAAQALLKERQDAQGAVICVGVVWEEGSWHLDAAILPVEKLPTRYNCSFEKLFIGEELPINLEEVLESLQVDLKNGHLTVPEEWLVPYGDGLEAGWSPVLVFDRTLKAQALPLD